MTAGKETIKQALKWAKEASQQANLRDLAYCQLAQSPLIASTLPSGEPHTNEALGQAVEAVLQWGVDRLKPSGSPQWTKPWRAYHLLYYFYLQGETYSTLDKKMGGTAEACSEKTFFNRLDKAIEALTAVIAAEEASPQDRAGRQRVLLNGRYQTAPPASQTLLRWLSLFTQSIPMAWLETQTPTPDTLDNIRQAGWVDIVEAAQTLTLHPEARPFLQSWLTPAEKKAWHTAAANLYRQQQAHLLAAFHWGQTGAWETAVAWLYDHFQDLQNEGQLTPLQSFLAAISRANLSPIGWGKRCLMIGQIVALQDSTAALLAYTEALSCPDIGLSALAYYRCAKLYQSKDLNEALAYYQRAIERLTPQPNWLLAEVLIDRAWLYIQSRPNRAQAEQDLTQAEALIAQLSDTLSPQYTSTQLEEIRQTLQRRLDEPALNALSFGLGVDYEALTAVTKRDKITELIAILAARGRVEALLTAVALAYPNQTWPNLPANITSHRKEQTRIQCALANAWAGLSFSIQSPSELTKRRLAWSLASELGDSDLLMRAAHNLGQALARHKELDTALRYLAQAEELANRNQNQPILGMTQKTMGAVAYWQNNYPQAIAYYQKALELLEQSGYDLDAGFAAYDLAEAYGKFGDVVAMQRAFKRAEGIAETLQVDTLKAYLRELAHCFVGLVPPGITLNERQIIGYDYLKTHPSLKVSLYCQLTGASPSTAGRDLTDMLEKGLLQKDGPHYKISTGD